MTVGHWYSCLQRDLLACSSIYMNFIHSNSHIATMENHSTSSFTNLMNSEMQSSNRMDRGAARKAKLEMSSIYAGVRWMAGRRRARCTQRARRDQGANAREHAQLNWGGPWGDEMKQGQGLPILRFNSLFSKRFRV